MKTFIYVLILLVIFIYSETYSQFGLPGAIKRKVEKEVEKAIEGKNEEEENDDENSDEENKEDKKTKSQDIKKKEGFKSFSKYDFIPGEKVIFFEDFSNAEIGDFPAGWDTDGSGEITTTNIFPGKWLQIVDDNAVQYLQLFNLPDNYTIEFDIIPILNKNKDKAGWHFNLSQAKEKNRIDGGAIPGEAGLWLTNEYTGRFSYRAYSEDKDIMNFNNNEETYEKLDQKYHIAIWKQKTRIRVYTETEKLFDIPVAFPNPNTKLDRIRFDGGAFLVSNIRIAVGAPDTRSKLITEGKLVSYGIYFDVNKDVVKGESYGTLKNIADALKENPNIRVKIIGFTDSDGDDAKNMDLSKRRADNVKNELINNFGIDASQLESDGKGETQPIAPNDTPANKALNRRVEFIKL